MSSMPCLSHTFAAIARNWKIDRDARVGRVRARKVAAGLMKVEEALSDSMVMFDGVTLV